VGVSYDYKEVVGRMVRVADTRGGRISFLEIHHPGRIVNIFLILVIDFVTANSNTHGQKNTWWMIKYPHIKKNAQQF
jgi:hypothetical protein